MSDVELYFKMISRSQKYEILLKKKEVIMTEMILPLSDIILITSNLSSSNMVLIGSMPGG